jgi:DNA-directed RNA polymerase specialized sigma24 family protein
MRSEARRDFDAWFSGHYDELVQLARKLHRDPHDLVHHTYLECVLRIRRNDEVVRNLPGYFHRSMFHASVGAFRRLYRIEDATPQNLVSDYDLSDAIKKEEALILTNHLAWFDRTVLSLYLDGWSMAELSRESGINASVLYESISQSKKQLRRVIRQRTSKS